MIVLAMNGNLTLTNFTILERSQSLFIACPKIYFANWTASTTTNNLLLVFALKLELSA